MSKIIPIFLIVLLAVPFFVQAQTFMPGDLWSSIKTYLNPLLVSWGWTPMEAEKLLKMPQILYHLLIPMIGVLTIVYGFLETLKIFDNRTINVILSIVIGITFLYSGFFFKVVEWMFRSMGIVSVLVFGLMFIGGIWLYKKRRLSEWGTLASIEGTFADLSEDLKQQLSNRRKEYEELTKKLVEEKNWLKRNRIKSRMREVKKEIDNILSRAKELKEEKEI